MPYNKKKQKCKQSDGDSGAYVLSYTDKKGKKHNNCHTSKKKMQGQIAAIEAEADMSDEEVLEEMLRVLIKEAVVSFEGTDYDIPDDEVEPIKKQLEFGSADPSPENSRAFDATKAVTKLKQLMGEKYQEVADKVNTYLPDTKAQISKVLVNNPALFADTVFTVAPSLGLQGSVPGPEWIEMINVHRPGRSKAVGRGEIALSLLLQGVTPDDGGGTHDLKIAGIGGTGEVHVKETASSGGMRRPDVPMGKNISGTDKQAAWAQSLDGTTTFDGKALTEAMIKSSGKAILDKFADIAGLPKPTTTNDYGELADAWQENFKDSFIESSSWGAAAGVAFISKESGEYSILGPDDVAPSRISDNKWRVSTKAAMGNRWSGYFKQHVPKQLDEVALRSAIGNMLTEDLTGTDKSDIKRMIKKEIEGPTNRREVDKAFKKNFNAELKKALGTSFFGTPGKVNKFVIDEIQKEVIKNLDSSASKDVIIFVCKEVIKKLYRELSFSSPQIIDRINPKV